MLGNLYRRVCAQRRLALAFVLGGTLLFVLASALLQQGSGPGWVLLLSVAMMLAGLGGQILGLVALMRSGKR